MKNIRAFTLVELLIAAVVLSVLCIPVYFLTFSTTRAGVMAAEELHAATLASEVIDAIRTLHTVTFNEDRKPLPAIPPGWSGLEDHVSPTTGETLKWRNLDNELCISGNAIPLYLPLGEASNLFLQSAPEGIERLLRIEYPQFYGESRDRSICRIRVLVKYLIRTSGKPIKKSYEMVTLLTLEDPIAVPSS